MERYLKRYFPVFVLPLLIAFLIAFVAPFLIGIYLSFTKFTTVIDAEFVGLDNYIKAFSMNRDFLNALWFTTKFAVISVVLINLFAFLLALALTQAIKATNLFRTVFFMPNLIGGIVLGYIWQLIINGFLLRFEVDITFSATYGFWGLVILMTWQMAGYMMVIYIAGLQGVPEDILEAAAIDGASALRTLLRIKLPMVMPSVTICTFLTLSNSFKLFDQNFALTGGAPGKKTAMMALDIYKTFYSRVGYEGVGQAKAVVFFVLVGLIASVQLLLTRRKEVEG